jgi:hypothetical protein
VEKLINLFGNLKNNLYICIMSLTKRWIESQMESGIDVLNQTPDDIDIEMNEYYCYYSGLPSVKAYGENEEFDNRY